MKVLVFDTETTGLIKKMTPQKTTHILYKLVLFYMILRDTKF